MGIPEKCTFEKRSSGRGYSERGSGYLYYENAIFSRQVTDLHKIQVKKAILCCKTYHARRSLMYYQLLYPETVIMVCPACPDGITRENWRETETGVEAVTGEIDRIVKQFCLMLGNR